jgi:MFS family permease
VVTLTPCSADLCRGRDRFAFDSYALLVLPLIVRPALADLLASAPNSLAVNSWVGRAVCPGDLRRHLRSARRLPDRPVGRRRVLVWSILLYGFSAVASGYATSVGGSSSGVLHVRRRVRRVRRRGRVAVGAVPDPKQRERVVGWTQAFGSIGGLMVTGAYYSSSPTKTRSRSCRGHAAWRYTLISG